MLEILLILGPGGVRGIPEGAVKFCGQNFIFWADYIAIISGGPPMAKASDEHGSDGEERKLGEQTGLDSKFFLRKSFAEDPSRPSRKRCELDVIYPSGMGSVGAKALSSPPGKYGRKAET